MAADLYDFRCKISALGQCAIAAHSRANDIDKSEVGRDIIEAWARKQAHGATLLQACMTAKGVTAQDAGIVGNMGAPLDWGDQ